MKRFIKFGERLEELRGHLTQKEFAEKINVPLRTYQRYESGERMPSINVLQKISYECNVSTKWLLTGDTDKTPFIDIGRRLFEVRLPIDKKSFAELLGLSIPQYHKYEQGEIKPPMQMLEKIATYRRTSVEWLLTGAHVPKQSNKTSTDINDADIENVKNWIDIYWVNLTDEEKIWFMVQFKKAFPEYDSWLTKGKK